MKDSDFSQTVTGIAPASCAIDPATAADPDTVKYNFSLATPDELPNIMAIYRSLIDTDGTSCAWDDIYPSESMAQDDIANKALFTLKDADKIIAVATIRAADESNDELISLKWQPQNPCELARLAVIKPMQKRGIASYMLQKVIAEAKSRGFDGIIMLVTKTNKAAFALYAKCGFERCGETYMYDMEFYRYQMMFTS